MKIALFDKLRNLLISQMPDGEIQCIPIENVHSSFDNHDSVIISSMYEFMQSEHILLNEDFLS